MWKSAIIGALVSLSMTGEAAAQDKTHQAGALHKLAISARDVAAEHAALCDQATLVAARAGLSPDQKLSREQLLSLFLVVSVKASGTHSS